MTSLYSHPNRPSHETPLLEPPEVFHEPIGEARGPQTMSPMVTVKPQTLFDTNGNLEQEELPAALGECRMTQWSVLCEQTVESEGQPF